MTACKHNAALPKNILTLEDRIATPEEAALMPGYAIGRVRYERTIDEAGEEREFLYITGRGWDLLPELNSRIR